MDQSINIATSAISSPPLEVQQTLSGASEEARQAIADAKLALNGTAVAGAGEGAKLQIG